jgi:hypothetical protein
VWFAVLVLAATTAVQAQDAAVPAPVNRLEVTWLPAPTLRFPNPTDSNSPAIWDGGQFYLFNSFGGQPRRAVGTSVEDSVDTDPDGLSASYTNPGMAGRWLEAVIRDDTSGRLYGWY